MADPKLITLTITQDEAEAIIEGVDNLATSSATANLLANVRAKIEDAIEQADQPDHPPPLNHDLSAESIVSSSHGSDQDGPV